MNPCFSRSSGMWDTPRRLTVWAPAPLIRRPLNVAGPAVHLAHPGQRLDQLALPVALDAGDADDLAGPHLQVEAVHGSLAAIVVDLQPGDVEHDVARVGVALLDLQHDAAPDHHVGQPGPVRLLRRRRADDLAAAQHGDRVAHGDRLAQLVGDEDDRRALVGQLAQHLRAARRSRSA